MAKYDKPRRNGRMTMETDWQRAAHQRRDVVRLRKMEKKKPSKKKRISALEKKKKKKDHIRQWLLGRNWKLDSLGRFHKHRARIRFGSECLYWEYRDFYDERWEIWGVGIYEDLRVGRSLSGIRCTQGRR